MTAPPARPSLICGCTLEQLAALRHAFLMRHGRDPAAMTAAEIHASVDLEAGDVLPAEARAAVWIRAAATAAAMARVGESAASVATALERHGRALMDPDEEEDR